MCTVALVVTVVIWAYQIYNNIDSGIIFAMGGFVLIVSVVTVATYRLDLTVSIVGLDILPLLVGALSVGGFSSILAGGWLFTKHTKEAAKDEARVDFEREELEQKAKKADGNLLTNLIRG